MISGDPGQPCVTSIPGSKGRKGEEGMAGVPGLKGQGGLQGETGRQGPEGEDGIPGRPGTPGLLVRVSPLAVGLISQLNWFLFLDNQLNGIFNSLKKSTKSCKSTVDRRELNFIKQTSKTALYIKHLLRTSTFIVEHQH